MSEPKRYFWLKLHKDFFQRKEIKRLRKIAGGDTYTIIYLKMLLRSIMSDGKLYFDGLEDDFASELALDLDEKEENVQITVAYLIKSGLLEMCSDDEYYLPDAKDNTGTETAVASRVRKHREKQKALQCNTDVTQVKHLCNGEIEKEKEKEINKEIDNKCASTKQKRKRFVKPTISDIEQYCSEKNISINAQQFIDYYESNGWKVGRNSMKDWQATVRRWASNNYGKKKSNKDNAINVVNNLMNKLGGVDTEQATTDFESTIDVTDSVVY